jgi:prepilin-type N-terminal cleavage/methylation domain-containing protein
VHFWSISTNKEEEEEKNKNSLNPSSKSRCISIYFLSWQPSNADQRKGSRMFQRRSDLIINFQGFSLIESMIALFILTFGLMATGQVLYTAAGLGHLARSKSTAVIAAQSTLEFLSDLYRRNPTAEELAPGSHGPITNQVVNPVDGNVLNRYSISWSSVVIPDSYLVHYPQGRILSVRVTPIVSATHEVSASMRSKTLTVTTLISPEIP